MNVPTLRAQLMLLLAAGIWGFAFVAQRVGMEYVGPFTFNAVRFALGAAALTPLLLARRRRGSPRLPAKGISTAKAVTLGVGLVGLVLFAGASLQQVGIVYTTAGKAGFITGLYVIIVPIMSLVWGRRSEGRIWAGAVFATAGLYLLCVPGEFAIIRGDLLVLISAFFWAGHVHLIGWLSERADPVRIAFFQFLMCSLLSFVVALAAEEIALSGILHAAVPIVYAGLFSVGMGYTLQVFAQRDAQPGHAAIILSFETVFAAIGGWLVLGEVLTGRAIAGCALMLAGMLVSQIDLKGAHASRRRPLRADLFL